MIVEDLLLILLLVFFLFVEIVAIFIFFCCAGRSQNEVTQRKRTIEKENSRKIIMKNVYIELDIFNECFADFDNTN